MRFSSQKIAPLFTEMRIGKVFRRGYFLFEICKGRLEIAHVMNPVVVSRKGG
jgi:hypothetical protein